MLHVLAARPPAPFSLLFFCRHYLLFEYYRFCEATADEFGVACESHLVDLEAKPAWFVALNAANGVEKAACPCALLVAADGARTFLKSSHEIFAELVSRIGAPPPAAGAFATGEAEVNAVMGAWFGMTSRTPATARDALAAAATRGDAIAGYVAFWALLEDALGGPDAYLSGGAAPCVEDVKWAVVTATFWEITDVFAPDAASACEAAYPRVAAWHRRVGDRPSVRRASRNSGPALQARYVEHVVGHYFPKLAPAVPRLLRDRLAALAPDRSPAERLASARAVLDAEAPALKPGSRHLFVGALRAHDANPDLGLGRVCCFSAFCEAAAVEFGLDHASHVVDLDHKPAWFLALAAAHDVTPQTPMLAVVDGAGAARLLGSSDAILAEYPRLDPERFATFAPAAGAFDGGDAEVTAMMGKWFGMMSKTPRDAAAAADAAPMLAPLVEGYVAAFAPLEAGLARGPFLNGTRVGREDLRWACLVRAFWKMTAPFHPRADAECRKRYPRTVEWCVRVCARPSMRRAADDDAVLFARFLEHSLGKYFPTIPLPAAHRDLLADAAPRDRREGGRADGDAAADGDGAAAEDDETRDDETITGLEKDELVNFCL